MAFCTVNAECGSMKETPVLLFTFFIYGTHFKLFLFLFVTAQRRSQMGIIHSVVYIQKHTQTLDTYTHRASLQAT